MKIEELQFRVSAIPANIERIRQAERTLGVSFPEDYFKFLSALNGGISRYYETGSDRDAIGIIRWASIIDVENHPLLSLELVNERLRDDSWKNVIVIGIDEGRNAIVLCTAGPNSGNVGLFDSGSMETADEARFLFTSFTDFVSNLRLHESERTIDEFGKSSAPNY